MEYFKKLLRTPSALVILLAGILALIGVIIQSKSDEKIARLPIDATLTAEAKLTAIANPTKEVEVRDATKAFDNSTTPVETAVYSTPTTVIGYQETEQPRDYGPYQAMSIILNKADPPLDTVLQKGEAITYKYDVAYYIPNYDWQSLNLEPRLHLVMLTGKNEASWNTDHLNNVSANTGSFHSLTLTGELVVPNDISTLTLRIFVAVREIDTGISVTGEDGDIFLTYLVSYSP